jgi:TolB protein
MCWGPARAGAQADLLVVKRGAEKTGIDLAGVRVPATDDGRMFRAVLAADLERSGWFVPAARGAALVVQGAARGAGGAFAIDCEVRHRGTNRSYLRRRLTAPNARRLAHVVADAIVLAVKGVQGIAATRIAMVGAHGVGKDLYLCDADGANLVKVTAQGAVCLSPNWWPDAQSLVYTSFHQGFPDVYRVELAARRRTKLAGFPGLNAGADISSDGSTMALALSRDGNPEIYTMSLRSRRLSRLTRWTRSSEASPSWAPDDNRLVFVSDRSGRPQLYVCSRRGGRPERISFGGRECVAPDWGPDGRIVYSRRRAGERYQLCIYEPGTRDTVQLTSGGADYEDPSWAPDGRHIVCVRTVNYKADLYILDTMGDAPIRLTEWPGDWYSPAWSQR